MLKLKRSIFNERNEKVLSDKNKIPNSDRILGEKVLNYIEHLCMELSIEERLTETLSEIKLKTRQSLKDAFRNNQDLYNGVMHVSTTIYHQLDKYLKAETGKENCKEKKVEDVLLKLVTKAALKPSPFSTFITTRITTDYGAGEEGYSKEAGKHIVTADVNHVHILRIFDAILNTEDGMVHSFYEINSLVMRNKAGDYGFVKLIDQPIGRPKVFRTDNVFKTVRKSEMMENLVNGLKASKRALSFQEICTLCGIEDQKEGIRHIQNLLECGAIYHEPKLGNNNRDILAEFQEKINGYGLAEVALYQKIKNEMKCLCDTVQRYQDADTVGKVTCIRDMKSSLRLIFEQCGLDVASIDKAGVLYEESYGTEVRPVSVPLSKQARTDLEKLFDLSLLFEGNVYMQQLFADMFVKVYGEDGRRKMEKSKIWSMLVKANTEFQYLWQNGWDIREKDDYPAEIRKLQSLKKKFKEYIMSFAGDEIVIDETFIQNEILDEIPEVIKKRTLSYAFFLQIGSSKVVLNKQYTGYLYNHCRYFDFFPENQALQDYIQRVFDGDEFIAENYETYGFNANCHRPISQARFLTGNSIDANREFGFEKEVALEDSYFYYSKEEKKVCLEHEVYGKYKPVNISSMAGFYLPGVMPALNNNSTSAMGLPDFKNLFFDEKTNKVKVIPRISLGNIVISRKAWFMKVNQIPKQEEGFVALYEWLTQMGIDTQVFVKAVYFEKTGDALIKPQYISFMNPLFIDVFYKMIEGYQNLIFEEVYPKPEQGMDYTSEYIYEVSK